MDTVLEQMSSICAIWRRLIKAAQKDKNDKFQKYADEAMAFFTGGEELWKSPYLKQSFRDVTTDTAGMVAPEFRTVVTKVAELQQLFGPTLYHQNPVRTINPKYNIPIDPVFLGPQFMDPMMGPLMQQQLMLVRQFQDLQRSTAAEVLEALQNWSAKENDLKTEARKCIDDALIKGMGILLTQLEDDPATGTKVIASRHENIDNFLMDPDAESQSDIWWCALKCVHSVWDVEREYRLAPGSLKDKAHSESLISKADNEKNYNKGETNDLITYYKIWSRCGFGDRLKDAPEDLQGGFEGAGDYVYLVVAEGVEYPLNLAPEFLETAAPEEIFLATQWPIPFWMDRTHPWPFSPLAFHWIPGSIWPLNHIRPGIPYLKWLTWAMSFLMNRVSATCGTIVAVAKSASTETKQQFLKQGVLQLIEVEAIHGNLGQLVQVLQMPPVNMDIWGVIEQVFRLFEQATGLNELLYGMAPAATPRSATDVATRTDNSNVRIDDMSNSLEDQMTKVARKEAMASRWLLTGMDVAPVVGQEAAMFWDQFIASTDPTSVVKEFDYDIEAGSARRQNKQAKQDQMNQALNTLGPMLAPYAQVGLSGPLNSLVSDWARAMNLDPQKYLIPQMMPPAPAPGQEGQDQQGEEKPPEQGPPK